MVRRASRATVRAVGDGWWVLTLLVLTVPAWFAWVMLFEGNTLASSNMRVMQEVASERTWMITTAAVSLFGFAAWFSRSRALSLLSSMILAGWHGLVALCIWQANPIGTGAGTYALLALAATLKMLEHRHASPSRN